MNVILFDIDGTLVLTGGAGSAAMESTLVSEFNVAGPPPKVVMSGRTDRSIIREYFTHYGIEPSDHSLERFFSLFPNHLHRLLHERQGQVLPGIVNLLERLSGLSDARLGLLTGNLRIGAKLKLERYGLMKYFAFGGFGDQHLHRNDVAREAYGQAQQLLNQRIDPQNVYVIGDTPLDIECARAIGAHAIAVATGTHRHDELAASDPDLLFHDLSDPAPFLELVNQG